MPSRLDQLGKGSLFQGMDEPLLTPTKKEQSKSPYENKNTESVNSDTK